MARRRFSASDPVTSRANLDAPDNTGTAPLCLASALGHHGCVSLLLDNGAQVDRVDEGGTSALHAAGRAGCGELGLTLPGRGGSLTAASLSHAMLSSTSRQPSHGLTVGMRDILASRLVLLLVFGEAKAEQLKRLVTGGLSTNFPASFLTLHQQVVCVCDEAAAARLPEISQSMASDDQ
mgnify:CR=1 FL=1